MNTKVFTGKVCSWDGSFGLIQEANGACFRFTLLDLIKGEDGQTLEPEVGKLITINLQAHARVMGRGTGLKKGAKRP